MTKWWIKVVELEDEAAITSTLFFTGKEMYFNELDDGINKLSVLEKENIEIKIRYELYQSQDGHQKILIGTFTWKNIEHLSLFQSLEKRLDLFVKIKQMDKKIRKAYLTSIKNTLVEEIHQKFYPPKEKRDTKGTFVKKEKAVKKRIHRFTFHHTLKKGMIEKGNLVTTYCKRNRKKLGFFFLGMCILSIVPFILSLDIQLPTSSFERLSEKQDYKEMYEVYPEEFWEWEQQEVKRKSVDTLESVYKELQEPSIAFDIAFLEESYQKVIDLYKEGNIQMIETRYDFLGFSYIQENQLEQAEELVKHIESKTFYLHLMQAYLQHGQVDKAEEMNMDVQNIEMEQKIEQYRLIQTTLDEINRQIQRKDLSEDIKSELKNSQKRLEEELGVIKNGKGETSE